MPNQYSTAILVLLIMKLFGYLTIAAGIVLGLLFLNETGVGGAIIAFASGVLGGILQIGIAEIGKAVIDNSIANQESARKLSEFLKKS